MTRAILLHIGAPKAGSTFLQRVLVQNRDRLAARGISYPHPGSGHPGNAGGLPGIDEEGLEAMFAGRDLLILSHEDLFSVERDAQPLSRLTRRMGIPVRRLVFLRPWSGFCFGDYSQHLKQNFDRYLAARRPFDGQDFLTMAARRAEKIDPVEFFLRWTRVFPLPPMVLAPHHAIRPTLEALTGATDLDWEVPRHLTNPSLRLTDINAIAAMMRDPAVPEDRVKEEYLAAYHRVDDPDPDRSPGLVAEVEAMFARQNRELMQVYGYDNRMPGPR